MDEAPGGGPPPGPMLLAWMLNEGSFGLEVVPTEDGLTVAWGATPPLTLVVDGPAVKLDTPAGRVRVRARTTSYGLALERKASGATLSETLFREGETLVVGIEVSAQRGEKRFLRRVYTRAPGPAPASPAG